MKVLVPEDRLAEFYAQVGSWLQQAPQRPEGAGRGGGGAAGRRSGRGKAGSRAAAAEPARGRYAPLAQYLSDRAAAGEEALEISFDEIEQVLGAPLPASARAHRAFWANSPASTRAQGWLSAGWRVSGVDLEEARVSFAKE